MSTFVLAVCDGSIIEPEEFGKRTADIALGVILATLQYPARHQFIYVFKSADAIAAA